MARARTNAFGGKAAEDRRSPRREAFQKPMSQVSVGNLKSARQINWFVRLNFLFEVDRIPIDFYVVHLGAKSWIRQPPINPPEHFFPAQDFEQVVEAGAGGFAGDRQAGGMDEDADFYAEGLGGFFEG